MASDTVVPEVEPARCAECNTQLADGQDREVTEGAVFCRPCFANLTRQLQQALAEQGRDVNYPFAFLGALLGGALGGAVWWGFTVMTKVAFGLVAVVIGFTVGKGVVLLSGNKRSVGLQALSAVVATLSFFYASYLVNRTFIQQAYAAEGTPLTLPMLPAPQLFFQVVSAGFGLMDLVFLAIVVWQAWKMPAPVGLRQIG